MSFGLPPVAQRHAVDVRLSEDAGGLALEIVEPGRSDGLSIAARCRLEEAPGGTTRLSYEASARLGGLAALLGGGAARRTIDDFFANLSRELAGPAGAAR